MFKYALIDLNDTEFFNSEDEARERADEWLDAVVELARDAIKDADGGILSRWETEERFYVQNDDISQEIRIYKIDTDVFDIDTDVFDEDLDHRPDLKIFEAECKNKGGVERIETFYTDIHSLFSDSELEELNDYYKEDFEEDEDYGGKTMKTEITYLLKVKGSNDIVEYSLDGAKHEAKRIMSADARFESIEIHRKDSRYAGTTHEGTMERGLDGVFFDSAYPEPARRYFIITGSDDNQDVSCEADTTDNAIAAWCDTIKSQGNIDRPWNCSIREEIFSDDGEWIDVFDGDPWNGFSIRRER